MLIRSIIRISLGIIYTGSNAAAKNKAEYSCAPEYMEYTVCTICDVKLFAVLLEYK